MRSDRAAVGIVVAGLGPILVAALLVPLRDTVANTNIALTLVVVVVGAAVVGGRGAGAVAAVTAAASYDFFFTRPYLSLTIDSRDDVETTVLLLVVGLLVGTIAAHGRQARHEAESARDEIRRVHRLAELAAGGADATIVIDAAQDELVGVLGLIDCRFETPPYATEPPVLERSGTVSGLDHHRFTPDGFELPSEGVQLPVLGRGRPVGRFVLTPAPGVGLTLDRRVVAVALADQVGALLAAPSDS